MKGVSEQRHVYLKPADFPGFICGSDELRCNNLVIYSNGGKIMNAVVIPTTVNKNAEIKIMALDVIEPVTFASLELRESDIEEFVSNNLNAFLGEHGSEDILIIGRQVMNKENGRSDLVAIDPQGNIVVIEIKRDLKDCQARAEAFEMQAIRYAANYSLINNQEDLLNKLYIPYVERFEKEKAKETGKTVSQFAYDKLNGFLKTREINRIQQIVLIASEFDPQALSACAWLHKNGIDITCVTIAPIKHLDQVFMVIEQILPPPSIDEFFVPVANPSSVRLRSDDSIDGGRITLPTMPKLFNEWKLIKPGDTVYIRDREDKSATVESPKRVHYNGESWGFNDWAKEVTGWQAVNIYEWTILKETGKTLDQLRREKMREEAAKPESLIC